MASNHRNVSESSEDSNLEPAVCLQALACCAAGFFGKLRFMQRFIIIINAFPPFRGGEDGCGPTRWEGLQSLNCYLCVYVSVSRFGCVFVLVSVSASVGAIRNACVHIIISASAFLSVPMPL